MISWDWVAATDRSEAGREWCETATGIMADSSRTLWGRCKLPFMPLW
jgi:hypothetical protein